MGSVPICALELAVQLAKFALQQTQMLGVNGPLLSSILNPCHTIVRSPRGGSRGGGPGGPGPPDRILRQNQKPRIPTIRGKGITNGTSDF